jgi:hypothetical protein
MSAGNGWLAVASNISDQPNICRYSLIETEELRTVRNMVYMEQSEKQLYATSNSK